jgi:hypothetical protein
MRWCPSCRRGWPAGGLVCRECLVELVDDPDATVRCRHCDQDWPARMHSCPVCLADLRLDPDAAAGAMGDILAAGRHLFRPGHLAAFRDGPACSIRRLSGRGGLVILGPDGLVEAAVDGPGDRAVPPLACRDLDGSLLFRLLRYEPADQAVVAVAADGAPLATCLRSAGGIDVRDGTSAPVGVLRRVRGGFELVETGGGALVTGGTADREVDGWVDDTWWFRPVAAALPLRPLGAVALVVAVKVLWGRPSPVRAEARDERDDRYGVI